MEKVVSFAPADSVISGANFTETLGDCGETVANVFEGLKEDPVEAPLLKLESQVSAGTEKAEAFGGYIDEDADGPGIDQRGFTKVNDILA